MSSYYNRIQGSLEAGKTARADDIHLIQSSIKNMIRQVIIDMCGTAFVLGESENALKLYATNSHVDQSNLDSTQSPKWVSFYDKYLRQPIDINKSSINTIRVQMLNDSKITVKIYAEIRDSDFELVKEANATLKPTSDEHGTDIEFHFNENHLPIGRYYFVLRPVDISATDLVINNDESYYDDGSSRDEISREYFDYLINKGTIDHDYFCIRYDPDGNYNKGLEASFDGATYLKASLLEENLTIDADGDINSENNPDLYFEEIFSDKNNNTYLIDTEGAAVILGEKVYPLDTHVSIAPPPDNGNRIDLVTLTTDGQLIVKKGQVYTNEQDKDYPINNSGLNIAYITNFKASTKKLPAIEQSDENHITRHRDILERLRRVEKKLDYQINNNSPTRIQYNCTVDPVIDNSIDDNYEIRGEGTYGVGSTVDADGQTLITNTNIINFAWSIIKDNYTYNVETNTNENGKITVWDTYTTSEKDSYYNNNNQKGLYQHYIEVMDHSEQEPKPVPGLELTIQIKKGDVLKKTLSVTTNKDGQAKLTFFSLKLAKGTYSVYTIYQDTKIKSKLVVAESITEFKNKVAEAHSKTLSLPEISGTSVTHRLPEGVIAGDDSFYKEKVDVDVDKGEVRIKKISDISDTYEINDGKSLLKDLKQYKSEEHIYLIDHKETGEHTAFPALNVTFDREVFIKSITPYIEKLENIESFGILIFKNEKVHNNAERKIYKKKIAPGAVDKNNYDDATFPTLYKSEYTSLKDLVKKSGNYQVLQEQVTFDKVNLDLEPGTYTIMLCPKLEDATKDGSIVIKLYKTNDDINLYGTNGQIMGNYTMSNVYIDTTDLQNTSWDIAINHKTYQYYDSGTLISKPVHTGVPFSACHIVKNFSIPSNCDIKLYVSNNGGTTWKLANTNHVKFDSVNTSFRWKLEMQSNNISTPKLKFNNTLKNAISFSLATSVDYVEYEDYNKCYETPLLNANNITRGYTKNYRTTGLFSEWEFARIFMENDEDAKSKIDILLSFADDDYTTNAATKKDAWGPSIFFSTVFADLTLDDFKHESVDYDNYEANVEYDEYNYRFLLDSTNLIEHVGGLALAAPNYTNIDTGNTTLNYVYGNINDPTERNMNNYFDYVYVNETDSPYEYEASDKYEQPDEEGNLYKYNGMRIIKGPYVKAVYSQPESVEEDYTANDTVIGIRFNNGLDINNDTNNLVIGLFAHKADENNTNDKKAFFPSGTFKISLSLGKHGEASVTEIETVDGVSTEHTYETSSGKDYIINKKLYSDEYTEFSIDLANDFDTFSVSDINSIAIKVCHPQSHPLQQTQDDADFIGIGRITGSSYNIRPYTPYMSTGSRERLQWKKLTTNENAQAFAVYKVGALADGTEKGPSTTYVYYPLDDTYDDIKKQYDIREISTYSENLGSGGPINQNYFKNGTVDVMKDCVQLWHRRGVHRRRNYDTKKYVFQWGKNQTYRSYIVREQNQFHTYIHDGNKEHHYVNTEGADEIMFQLPEGELGNLFKINTDIPYTLYNLIEIEYWIFSEYWLSSDKKIAFDPRVTNYLIDVDSNIDTNGHLNIHENKKIHKGDIFFTEGSFSKGEIYIDFYDTRDITKSKPFESFALPSWGRIATRSEEQMKIVHSWFKKRNNKKTIRCIVIRRENPRNLPKEDIKPIKLTLNNILFFNAEYEAALGPQMQMRIYPNNTDNMTNTKIRKIGGIYRI